MRDLETIAKELESVKLKLQKLRDMQIANDEFYDLLMREGELKIEAAKIGKNRNEKNLDIVSLAEAIKQYETMPKKPKYATGVSAIDNNFDGGLELAQLIIVAGEKGAGKTLLTMQILFNVSNAFKTALFTLEMPSYKIVERLLKRKDRFNNNILNNLFIADKKFTLDQIENMIRFEVQNKGTKFFVIDSFMKIQTSKNFSKVHEKYSHISNTLSRLAIELDVIIFVVAQMSKEDIKHKNLALKNSGDAEYDADIIFYIMKDKKDNNKRLLICDKNRQNGNEFKETLTIDKSALEFKSSGPEVEVEYAPDVVDMPVIDGGW